MRTNEWTFLRLVAVGGLCLSFCLPAFAQDEGDGKKSSDDENPFIEGSLETEEEEETSEPEETLDLEAVDSFDEKKEKEEKTEKSSEKKLSEEERNEVIDRNYEKTLETYERILEREKDDTRTLEKRIRSNKELIRDYTPKLESAERKYRRMQVEFIQKAHKIKRDRESGRIDEKTMNRLLERSERRYRQRRTDLKEEIDFFDSEINAARKRLSILEGELAYRQARQEEAEKAARKAGRRSTRKRPRGQILLDLMSDKLRSLNRFHTRYPLGHETPHLRLIGAPLRQIGARGTGRDTEIDIEE